MSDGLYVLGAGAVFTLIAWWQHKKGSVAFGSLYFDRRGRPRLFLFIQLLNLFLSVGCLVVGVVELVTAR
ncbi:MAG: hypothetical protein WAU68_12320 [Vitreimonas sp.]